ncbi:hypothetical protein P5V34_00705 [Mycobacteroides abscessus subsp. abscessus]|nr:hypothetical protein [Mycobacteroides abscessus]MDO3012500.1 hypothetical protein [Mycobacteroides abscessus subsp. abscessus]
MPGGFGSTEHGSAADVVLGFVSKAVPKSRAGGKLTAFYFVNQVALH